MILMLTPDYGRYSKIFYLTMASDTIVLKCRPPLSRRHGGPHFRYRIALLPQRP